MKGCESCEVAPVESRSIDRGLLVLGLAIFVDKGPSVCHG
jgi:hypothetical protein